ncbi:MAG: hypothetical protein AABY93_15105 [Bacteroidota bacterium]
MKSTLLFTLLAISISLTTAQVSTNFNNPVAITAQGKFKKEHSSKAPYIIPAKDIKALLKKEALEDTVEGGKPFRIAEAVPVSIDVVSEATWVEDGGFVYGKFKLVAAGAKSISINFDRFYLPESTELYVYVKMVK